MFTDLAVVDWIALVFAAVLLSAAIAAAVLAYLTSAHHQKPSFAMFRRRRSSASPMHAAGVDDRAEPDEEVASHDRSERAAAVAASARHRRSDDAGGSEADVIDLTDDSNELDREQPSSEDLRLAERAARLRGRPVPESPPTPPPVPTSGQAVLEHRALVQNVVANRVPAHAEVLHATSMRSGVSTDNSNFDRAEGFKTRNPGFFDDPMGRHELRYWDGHTWTEYVKEHGERFTDPL